MKYKSNFGYISANEDGGSFTVFMPDGTYITIPSDIFNALFTEVEE